MKRYPLLILILTLFLPGCSQKHEKILRDFAVDNWSSSIGALDNTTDNVEEQKYSYTLYLVSETGKLESIQNINPVISDNIKDRIIISESPHFEMKGSFIEVQGDIIFDASGLIKEQILTELNPFITGIVVIDGNNVEYTIEVANNT